MNKVATYDAGIPYGPQFMSQMLDFQSRSMLMAGNVPEKNKKGPKCLGHLPPTRRSQMKLLAPGITLSQFWPFWPFGEVNQ